jgi:hypothetical protein
MNSEAQSSWRCQLSTLWPHLVLVYSPIVILITAVAVFALMTGRPGSFFTRDPFVIARLPFYAGLISNVGIVLWCALCTVCLFNSVVLKKLANGSDWGRFFLYSGILTFILLFDDLFQFHRILYPRLLHVSMALTSAAYAGLAIWLLWRFRGIMEQSEYLLLLLAFFFLGFSIVLDVTPMLRSGRSFIADGFKLLGITSWLTYVSRSGAQEIMRAFAAAHT